MSVKGDPVKVNGAQRRGLPELRPGDGTGLRDRTPRGRPPRTCPMHTTTAYPPGPTATHFGCTSSFTTPCPLRGRRSMR